MTILQGFSIEVIYSIPIRLIYCTDCTYCAKTMQTTTHKPQLAQIPCTELKGVGPRMSELLAKCAIFSVQDLLFHLPFRYQDRTHVTPIQQLRPGDTAVIEGVIIQNQVVFAARRSLICEIQDNTGTFTLRFFNFNTSQRNSLAVGTTVRCFGEVRYGNRSLSMIHPEYRRVNPGEITEIEETLTPIYPTTEGLQQRSFYQLTDQALALLNENALITEYLPLEILQQFKLPNLVKALQFVHRPPPKANVYQLMQGQHPAQRRLVFEELLAHHLSLRRLRLTMQQQPAPALPMNRIISEHFLQQLSFPLTAAQLRVSAEVAENLALSQPMLRLVQGDVGSGKTVVAVLALLQAVANNYQAAFMAPTELLAEQHFCNLEYWLKPLNIEVVLLASKMTSKLRAATLEKILSGNAQIIVGTHALFQDAVQFKQLGLIIIDEQHRFGVHQRLALRAKGLCAGLVPHQLIMTATPIPRTLAMTAYADLDVSIIDELPPGRTPVKTIVISNQRRAEVLDRVRVVCAEQRQVYWVCTLIEESEQLQCQAAEVALTQLQHELGGLKIGLVHGRMKTQEKEQIMSAFKARELDVLVATTVIEVGVDVPNACLMVIENAERLGLAQLHQLRGRVGRGSLVSYCVLFYQAPLSGQARARLDVLRKSNDGFVIAQRDLEIRGPGEVLGTRQTGLLQLRIANIVRDNDILPEVQQAAGILLRDYPQLVEPLIRRWLGHAEQFAQV